MAAIVSLADYRPGTSPAEAPLPRQTLLVVGPARPGRCPDMAPSALVVHARMAHLTRALLNRLRPDMILTPLFARDGDILDLARLLKRAGYRGQLIVQSQPLPSTDLVLGELRDLFPELALTFIQTTD